jgi:AraC-like DNA-binding protein
MRHRISDVNPRKRPAGPSEGSQGPILNPRIAFTRASGLIPSIAFLDEIGAPTERLLSRAGISAAWLEDLETLVPLHLAHALIELAARSQGVEDLAVVVGRRTSAFELGAFGQKLEKALTVREYLRTGMELIGSVTSGQRFWLTDEGERVRFHQHIPGRPGEGRSHADLYTLTITIEMLCRFVDQSWRPEEVCLLAGDEKLLREPDTFGDARIVAGQSHSSFTIPRSLLHAPIPRRGNPGSNGSPRPAGIPMPMPEGFVDGMEQLIAMLLIEGYPRIDAAAEAAGMNVRTLQRRLRGFGLTYSQMVSAARMRLAGEWLINSCMAISEIAFLVGYENASNFTRAFRRRTGTSPQAFRAGSADK